LLNIEDKFDSNTSKSPHSINDFGPAPTLKPRKRPVKSSSIIPPELALPDDVTGMNTEIVYIAKNDRPQQNDHINSSGSNATFDKDVPVDTPDESLASNPISSSFIETSLLFAPILQLNNVLLSNVQSRQNDADAEISRSTKSEKIDSKPYVKNDRTQQPDHINSFVAQKRTPNGPYAPLDTEQPFDPPEEPVSSNIVVMDQGIQYSSANPLSGGALEFFSGLNDVVRMRTVPDSPLIEYNASNLLPTEMAFMPTANILNGITPAFDDMKHLEFDNREPNSSGIFRNNNLSSVNCITKTNTSETDACDKSDKTSSHQSEKEDVLVLYSETSSNIPSLISQRENATENPSIIQRNSKRGSNFSPADLRSIAQMNVHVDEVEENSYNDPNSSGIFRNNNLSSVNCITKTNTSETDACDKSDKTSSHQSEKEDVLVLYSETSSNIPSLISQRENATENPSIIQRNSKRGSNFSPADLRSIAQMNVHVNEVEENSYNDNFQTGENYQSVYSNDKHTPSLPIERLPIPGNAHTPSLPIRRQPIAGNVHTPSLPIGRRPIPTNVLEQAAIYQSGRNS
jgi:hypothetical protein